MSVPALLLPLVVGLDDVNQKPPADNDVVAGWVAFGVFLLLAAAIAFLGWSMSRQFKKVRAAREAGVFGEPETGDTERSTDGADDDANDGATPKA